MFYNETVFFFPSQPYCDARGQQCTTCIRPVTPTNDDNLGVHHYGIAPIETRRLNMEISFQKS